jgi:hypothetical protein
MELSSLTEALALVQGDTEKEGDGCPDTVASVRILSARRLTKRSGMAWCSEPSPDVIGTSATAVHRHRHAHLSGHLRQPAPPAVPALSPDVQQAIAAYQEAMASYEAMRQTDWRRSAYSPGALLSPAWREVQVAAQQLRALGVDPDSLIAL